MGEVVETYRGVELEADGDGRFRIETNLAELVGFDGSNGDLQDELQLADARDALVWSSEGDTLVVTSPDLETCRAIIDAAFDLAE